MTPGNNCSEREEVMDFKQETQNVLLVDLKHQGCPPVVTLHFLPLRFFSMMLTGYLTFLYIYKM